MPRTKTSSSFQNMINREKKIILQVRNWLILIVVVLLIGLGIYLISHLGSVTEISSVVLPCYAYQDVTPFGDSRKTSSLISSPARISSVRNTKSC